MDRSKLSSRQRRRLRQLLREATDVRLYRRVLAVLEFDGGKTAAEIARMLDVTRQSVYNWVDAFAEAGDPAALTDSGREGRPRLLEEYGDALSELLATSPQDLGLPHVGWTAPLLRQALQRGTGRAVSGRTVRRELVRLGYAWKRPRYVLAPDPEREKKTADQASNPGLAAAERRAGSGRDRPAAVPAAAGRLVAAGATGRSRADRLERPADHLRRDEPADGFAGVCAPA